MAATTGRGFFLPLRHRPHQFLHLHAVVFRYQFRVLRVRLDAVLPVRNGRLMYADSLCQSVTRLAVFLLQPCEVFTKSQNITPSFFAPCLNSLTGDKIEYRKGGVTFAK